MSTKWQQRQARRQAEQASKIDVPITPKAQVPQQPTLDQQQQWLSTNAGMTPNLDPQNSMLQQTPGQQPQYVGTPFATQPQSSYFPNTSTPQAFGQLAIPGSFPQAISPLHMAEPSQAGYNSYIADQQASTVITTTTTTTTQSNQQVGSYGQQQFEPTVAQVTGQMQNMQIQQPYSEPPAQAALFQLQLPPQPIVEAPPLQQLPPQQLPPQQPPPVSTPPVSPPQQGPPVIQNQDPRYPVTTEQRQSAWFQWRAEHPTKPQRTLDRMMQEYMSGKKDKQIYEMLITQQQSQQIQNTPAVPQASKELQRAERGQKRQDRQKEREERQQQRQQRREQAEAESFDPWQNMQNQWGGQALAGMFGGFGVAMGAMGSMGATGQSLTTTQTAQIITQQGVTSKSGENRRKAVAEGPEAVQRLEIRVQQMIAASGICPKRYAWVPDADSSGYMCCGGNHFIPDKEVDLMLANEYYSPQWKGVNHISEEQFMELGMFGAISGPVKFCPLKKPPNQVPRHLPCWKMYEGSKRAKQLYESGQYDMAMMSIRSGFRI